ncbi:MAG: hypothetical protein RIE24_07615 [Silicimonas sp.]
MKYFRNPGDGFDGLETVPVATTGSGEAGWRPDESSAFAESHGGSVSGLGFMLSGTLAGIVGSAATLFMGGGLLAALLAYMLTGVIAMMILIALICLADDR